METSSRLSLTTSRDLSDAIRTSAARDGVSISAWLADAAVTKLRIEQHPAPSNRDIDAAIRRSLNEVHYGETLAARGITTVALDDDGNLIEYRPDGTTRMLRAAGG